MQKLLIAIIVAAFVVGAGPSAAQVPTALAEMNAVGHIKFEAKGKKGKSKAGKKSRGTAKR